MDPDRILVRRDGALGDVILTTPIVHHLTELYPDAVIGIGTGHPEVFAGFHDRVVPAAALAGQPEPDLVIDLDLAYERRPKMHIVDAYAEAAFGHTGIDKTIRLGRPAAKGGLPVLSDTVAIHPGVGWRARTFSPQFWSEVARDLLAADHRVVLVGTDRDRGPHEDYPEAVQDLRGRLYLHAVHEFLQACKAVVCVDTAVLHIAGATETPILGLFTNTFPRYRLPYRHGQLGWGCRVRQAAIDCRGCHHDLPPPVTHGDCRRGDFACLWAIDPAEVVDALMAPGPWLPLDGTRAGAAASRSGDIGPCLPR